MNASDKKIKAKSWQLFDRIAYRYDILNRILSIGIDVYWRKKIIPHIPIQPHIKLLDLATGTGDVLFTISKSKLHSFAELLGMDLSENMMSYGREKKKKYCPELPIRFTNGDATRIPISADTFDVVTMAFGIRNVANVSDALREIHRILKPNGKLIILEFSIPQNKVIQALYLFYFRYILPKIGGVISGDQTAYQYLNTSVEDFPYGKKMLNRIIDSGFTNAKCQPLTFGIASLYIAQKT